MWHRVAGIIIKFRVALLVLLLIATGIMGYFASQVQLSYEFTSAIPTDNPKYIAYQQFRKQFGEDGNLMVIGMQTDRFFSPDFFLSYCKLVKKIENVKSVENVLSIPGAINLIKDTASGKLRVVKLVPDGSNVNVDSVKKVFLNLPFYKNFLYNPATDAYLMAVRIDKKALNSKNRTKVVKAIQDVSEVFAQEQHITLHYSGLPLIRTIMATQVQREMRLFLLMSFVLTAVILALFFRSFMAVLASMLVVAVGVVWSLGTITLLGYKITLLTALIPPLIVVIGIPNCVYLLNKYHAEYNKHGNKMKALMRTVDRMGIVTLFTNLTAAIGFGVFYFTKSAVLKEFGLVAGLNIMAIFVISLIFIPALFSFLPTPKGRHTSYLESRWMNKLLSILTAWVFEHRRWIYVFSILLCGLSIVGISRLNSVGHIVDDLPKGEVVYQDLKFFEKNFRGVMPLEIVIDTRKKNGAVSLPVLEKMDRLIAELNQYPEIGHSLSIVEGVKFARQAYYDGDSSSYTVPNVFDGAFIQPYLRSKGDKNSMFNKLVASFMDSTKQKTRISVSMADVGSVRLPVLLDSIRPKTLQLFDTAHYQVTFTGTSIVFLEGSKFIINSLRDSLVLAFIMIFGCMIFLFRSWRILLISVVTNLIPLLITAGVMGWANIPIKPSTVLVFSVALGITIDVTIRFLVNFKQELSRHDDNIAETVRRTIHDTGLSIIYTSLILIAGFGVFALSEFDGTKSLGYLTSLTLLLAMITNLTLQPALLLWIDKAQQKKIDTVWLEDEE
ncbi:MAG: MMPL family transporter [Bacteroidetes bacterium]|nr:MMPL family transporter [Bacteroidota bacterium]MBS1740036.1 MMPL family transporter [Bacteroidota bacterium]